MAEERHEYSEHLWITTGVCGAAQESSFANATLQSVASEKIGQDPILDFSIALHVAVPAEVRSEQDLHLYLRDVLYEAIHHTDGIFGPGTLNFEVQMGPFGDAEEE